MQRGEQGAIRVWDKSFSFNQLKTKKFFFLKSAYVATI